MDKKAKKLIAAALTACSIAAVTPVGSVPAGAASATQSVSKTTTMYVKKTAYTYVKKNGKLVKSTKLTKGTEIKVKSSTSKYYILTSGKYILKTSVGSKRTNWTDTKLSKASARYVQEDGAAVLDKALPTGKTVKTLSAGTKITIVAKTNSGYFKLKDGGYILQSLVGKKKPSADVIGEPSSAAKLAGSGITLSESEGKVFNIYCWTDEFKGYFEKYYTVPKGVTVNWNIIPSNDGFYREKLDIALKNQSSLPADERVDLFLAEPDYLRDYVDSGLTMDVGSIGVKPYTTEYKYTYQAATDSSGKLKGVSYLLCPSALIYRRSIAENVLGTSDPDKVQQKLDTWTEFSSAAQTAANKGYYITASFAETFRAFTQPVKSWVDKSGNVVLDPTVTKWLDMTKGLVDSNATLPYGLWDSEKSMQMGETGKTMCFFGPSWYYNYCMFGAESSFGDWAIAEGPEAHYWGGVWLLAANGSDNPEMIADVMNAFTVNEDICGKLCEKEELFTNNRNVNDRKANDSSYGVPFLGGQNDYKVLCRIADDIRYFPLPENDVMASNRFLNKCRYYFYDGASLSEVISHVGEMTGYF